MPNHTITTAIILAAGKNTRFDTGIPKSLQKLGNETLLERHIRQFQQIGVQNIAVVTGFRGEHIKNFIESINQSFRMPVHMIFNEFYERANGISILVTQDWIRGMGIDHFYCTMSDHIYSGMYYESLAKKILNNNDFNPQKTLHLGVDRPDTHNTYIDLEDVTRVLISGYSESLEIQKVGKLMNKYTHFDTGMFVFNKQVFTALNYCSDIGKDSISDMVNHLAADQQAQGIDMTGLFWNDIDTPEDFKTATSQLYLL